MMKLSPLAALLVVLAVFTAAVADEQPVVSLPDTIIPPDTLQSRLARLVRLGELQLDNGDSKLAEKTFKQAMEIAPDNPRVNLGMGRSFLAG